MFSRTFLAVVLAVLLAACASGPPPLQALDRHVDLDRFMGDWYVLASIPIFVEKGAHNGVESYRLDEKGVIRTTYRFRKGSFDAPVKTFEPNAIVWNRETNAEWGMQFIWPFRASYLIIYLDDSYQRTIIGVPSRRWVWLMSRSPEVSDAEYAEMVTAAEAAGYDPALIERIPQQWPEKPESQAGK